MITASEASKKALEFNMKNVDVEQVLTDVGAAIEEAANSGKTSIMFGLAKYNLSPQALQIVKRSIVTALGDYGYSVTSTIFELYISW